MSSACPLEIPQCKRQVMSSNGPYQKRVCPLSVKPRCALLPPACPLVTSQGAPMICGLSKLQNPGNPLSVAECPNRSSCPLASSACPISFNTSPRTEDGDNEIRREFPTHLPPCSVPDCEKRGEPTKKKYYSEEKINENYTPEAPKEKRRDKRTKDTNKCPVSASRRPLPCAECVFEELSGGKGPGRALRTCPFVKMADMCGPLCKCEEVPEVESGPRCPFLPKPCPCCSTPRCPLSKEPDCPLRPKPLCQALASPCYCGKNCAGETVIVPECEPLPTPIPPRCLCGGCPVGPQCPMIAPKCVCGTCPRLFPCCTPKPCLCGTCPIAKVLCLTGACNSPSPPTCPLNPQTTNQKKSCPLNPPSCPLTKPTCPLLTESCPLLRKPICPPIPPPCSLEKYELDLPPPVTTFHVPICPQYKPPCAMHLGSKSNQDLICPFSPHPCPLGPTCPFPIPNPKSTKPKTQASKTNLTKEKVVGKDICPGSSNCGKLPHPECPAAEVLCPERYQKKVKPKKEECPLKDCMRTPECPLSKAMPNVDCPMAESSDCPLAKEPDCPLVELASRCPISAKYSGLQQAQCPLEKQPPAQVPNNKKENMGSCILPNLPDCLKGALVPKADCPLAPKINCPLVQMPECPLAPPPPCPLAEFAPKSDCPMSSLACPLTSTLDCPLSGRCNLQTNQNDSTRKKIRKYPSTCLINQIRTDGGTAQVKNKIRNEKSSERVCPLSELVPKQTCPLAPPPCPYTPKPKCPLTKKPDPCPLSSKTLNCPIGYPACCKFPDGRCPMEKLNICDCDYPVSPCLAAYQESNVVAPQQYCLRQNCCMGLGLPPAEQPTLTKGDYGLQSDKFFYQFADLKPGEEDTKHYVEILNEPPDVEISLLGRPKKRAHDNWTIVKYGEGFKKCKTILRKLEELGPISNKSAQYLAEDCPPDPGVVKMIAMRKARAREMAQIEDLKRELATKTDT